MTLTIKIESQNWKSKLIIKIEYRNWKVKHKIENTGAAKKTQHTILNFFGVQRHTFQIIDTEYSFTMYSSN